MKTTIATHLKIKYFNPSQSILCCQALHICLAKSAKIDVKYRLLFFSSLKMTSKNVMRNVQETPGGLLYYGWVQ